MSPCQWSCQHSRRDERRARGLLAYLSHIYTNHACHVQMNHPCSHVYIASCIVSFAHRVSSEQHFGCVAIIVNVCGHIRSCIALATMVLAACCLVPAGMWPVTVKWYDLCASCGANKA